MDVININRSPGIKLLAYLSATTNCIVMKFVTLLMSVTQEYDFDLGSALAWGSQSIRCLWPETEVFQLNVHCVAMYSCFVCAGCSYNAR